MIKKGFTLIELMVVISIIGFLSSVVLGSLGTARAKSRDARVIAQFNQIKTALFLYREKYNAYPNQTVVGPNGPYTQNFDSMAQQLVSEGFLSSVPVAPTNHTYQYYNYYTGQSIGGLLVTTLEASPASTGYPGSCRPWASGVNNWCTASSNAYYCVCNPL
ncbi:MAG: putative Type IV pilus pilin [Parcubacteria bacterium C7867-005]|nr:MAG: putative Type IV pilus pilin [Parcubacteria bacterium C7867-005]